MDLLSAGTDTTSSSITFAIMFLAIHQDVQEKIHQEMDEVLGRDRLVSIADRPRYKKLNLKLTFWNFISIFHSRLTYTDAVFMEVLRMRAPLPIMIPHKVTQDATVCVSIPSNILDFEMIFVLFYRVMIYRTIHIY